MAEEKKGGARESQAPAKSNVRQIGESIVDCVAIAAVTVLAYAGKINSNIAVVVLCALAGVRVIDLMGGGGSGGPGNPPAAGGAVAAGGLAGLVLALPQFVTGAGSAVLSRVVARQGAR